jgi:transposase
VNPEAISAFPVTPVLHKRMKMGLASLNCTPKVGHKPTERGADNMTKISKEERLVAVKAIEEGKNVARVAAQYQVSRTVMRYYYDLYRRHGPEGLSRRTGKWSEEQKCQILEHMHQNHLSYHETSIQFGLSGSATLRQWERTYLENGKKGLEEQKNQPPRKRKPKLPLTQLEELLAENEYLRAENEYLKKLNTLVAEREKRE